MSSKLMYLDGRSFDKEKGVQASEVAQLHVQYSTIVKISSSKCIETLHLYTIHACTMNPTLHLWALLYLIFGEWGGGCMQSAL